MSSWVDTGARGRRGEYEPTVPKRLPGEVRRDGPRGAAAQPISQVHWVAPSDLIANDFNPNRQFVHEARLLKISLIESGWLSPLVAHHAQGWAATEPLILTDGFHRWWLATHDPEVANIADGLVPVVLEANPDPLTSRMTTLRMNRARGVHAVVGMADVVAELADLGATEAEIGARVGMEPEEVERLLDRGQMTKRAARPDGTFGNAWAPNRDAEAVAQEARDAMDAAEQNAAAQRRKSEREQRFQ